MPATQKFSVCLPLTLPHLPTASTQEASQKRKWPHGVLKGGCKNVTPSFDGVHHQVSGWWLCVHGKGWSKIKGEAVAGRTIRQEREYLGLMDLDSTRHRILVVSRSGVMLASWHYKFPHRAQDDVVLLVVSVTACDRLGQSPLQFAQSYLPWVSYDALADQNQVAMHEVGTAVSVQQCTAAKKSRMRQAAKQAGVG